MLDHLCTNEKNVQSCRMIWSSRRGALKSQKNNLVSGKIIFDHSRPVCIFNWPDPSLAIQKKAWECCINTDTISLDANVCIIIANLPTFAWRRGGRKIKKWHFFQPVSNKISNNAFVL